jgi:hypothetical protein
MTTTEEMLRAIDNARSFMYRLLDSKKTPRVPKSVRKEARDRLKHFPDKFDVQTIKDSLEFEEKVRNMWPFRDGE